MARISIERENFLFVTIFLVMGAVLFSLFKNQVLEHEQWFSAAQSQSVSTVSKPAERGKILAKDKDGGLYTLAISQWQYSVLISPREVSNKQKLVSALAEVLPNLDKASVLSSISTDSVYVPPVIKGLDEATAEKVRDANLAGVFVAPNLVRQYPDGSSIAPQVIGFVGSDGVGKYGVEATRNNDLVGISGDQSSKVDSLGRLINVLNSKSPQPGSDVVLTLDYNLQFAVEQQLSQALKTYKADSGSVIVMDPKTGAILADASQPNFDPNNISSITGEQLSDLLDRNASNVYEPGSVVKPLTMAMALDSGVLAPNTVHNAGGSVEIDGHTITNALNKNFGSETLSQIIQNSDNVQMSWISTLLSVDQQYSYLKKFGFGQATGVDIVGEQTGYLPDKKTWSSLLRATAAFGQGISTTTVNLAADYSVLANGGKSVTPHFVDYTINTNGVKSSNKVSEGAQIISTTTASEIDQMLIDTVNMGEGKRAGVPGMQVAGKTGTAQVPDASGGYDATKSIGSFAGYFPANDPKFVMVVRLDNPKTVNFAESSAAPTFGAIASWMSNYYGLK